jgi:hypothetical protein
MKSLQILIASLAIAVVRADDTQQPPAPPKGAPQPNNAQLCGRGLSPCPQGWSCQKLDRGCRDIKNQGNCIGSCTPPAPPPFVPPKQQGQPKQAKGGLFGQLQQPSQGFQGGFPQTQPPRGQGPQPIGGQLQPGLGQPRGGLGAFGQPSGQLGLGQPTQPGAPGQPPMQQAPKLGGFQPKQQQQPQGAGGLLGGLFGPKPPNNVPFTIAGNPQGPAVGPPPPPPTLAQGAAPPPQGRIDPIPIKQCPTSVRCSGRNVCVPSPQNANAYLCVSGDEDCGTWKNKTCVPGKACLADPRTSCDRGWCQGRDGICVVPPA